MKKAHGVILCWVLALGITPTALPKKRFQEVLTQHNHLAQEGFSVALSADGKTLAAGAPFLAIVSTGATQIYVKTSEGTSSWTHQATLHQNDSEFEGSSVSLSADGNLVAAGSPSFQVNSSYVGATQMYSRSGTVWVHNATLTQENDRSQEGFSVSLSADGNTLAVGAPTFGSKTSFIGATHIYIKSATGWQYQATLTQNVFNAGEGSSVSLSADGNTLAAGAPGLNYGIFGLIGGTQIYTRSGAIWTHQTTLNQKEDYPIREGTSVSLSADGNTLAASAPGFEFGSTRIYAKLSASWQYITTLTQEIEGSEEGASASLSADGSILAVGASNFTGGATSSGATHMYIKSGSAWKYFATLTAGIAFAKEGSSVTLSSSQNENSSITLAAGGPSYQNNEGMTSLSQNLHFSSLVLADDTSIQGYS